MYGTTTARTVIAFVLLLALPAPVWLQQCSPSVISWPSEQCTRRCPAVMTCDRQESLIVQIGDISYCCICSDFGYGTVQSNLCPGSGIPGLQLPQVRSRWMFCISSRLLVIRVVLHLVHSLRWIRVSLEHQHVFVKLTLQFQSGRILWTHCPFAGGVHGQPRAR